MILRTASTAAALVGALLATMSSYLACSASGGGDEGGAPTTTSTSAGGSQGGGGHGGQGLSSGGDGGGGVGGEGGTGGTAGAGGVVGECGPVDGVVLAMDKLFLGDKTFGGQSSATAWKDFGFDLDGQITVDDFATHCKPYAGGPTSALADGTDGRDNSFGRNVMPLLVTLVPDLSGQANLAIQTGQFTLVMLFEGLGAEADKDPLGTKVYGGAELAAPPQWKGHDCWPVVPELLSDPDDIASSMMVFPAAALAANKWQSNGTTTLHVPLKIMGYPVPLELHGARMTVQLAPTHLGGALGQIGGVVDAEQFVEAVRDAAGAINPSYCDALFEPIAEGIRGASDILKDGTQDPSKTCDGISVGLGYTLLTVEFGAIAGATTPPADPCP